MLLDATRGIDALTHVQLPKHQKIVPWSYYFLGGAAVVGAIVGIAGYIFGQMAIFTFGAVAAVLGGLGAYEINTLCLERKFEDDVHDYKGLNDQLNLEIEQLKGEKKELDRSNKDLARKIQDIANLNQKIGDLEVALKSTEEEADKTEERLEEDVHRLTGLNEDLKSKLDLFEIECERTAKNAELERASLELIKNENEDLKEEIEQLKEAEVHFKEDIQKYTDQNKKLSQDHEKAELTLFTMTQKAEEINNDNKQLKKSLEDLKKERAALEEDMKKKSLLSDNLEATVKKLEDKVLVKLTEMTHLKEEHQQKIKDQQKQITELKQENEELKKNHSHKTHHVTIGHSPRSSQESISHHTSKVSPTETAQNPSPPSSVTDVQ